MASAYRVLSSVKMSARNLHLHQIWIQGEPPAQYNAGMQSWKDAHRQAPVSNVHVHHWLWRGDDIRKLIIKHYPQALHHYDHYPKVVQRADLGRVIILLVYGGVYMDMDMSCHRALPPLMQQWLAHSSQALLLSESCLRFGVGSRVNAAVKNCFVGTSQPAHPYLHALLSEMLRRDPTDTNVYRTTGPAVWNDVFFDDGHKFDRDTTVRVLQSYILAPHTYVHNPLVHVQSNLPSRKQVSFYNVASHKGEMTWCAPWVRKYARYSIVAALLAWVGGITLVSRACRRRGIAYGKTVPLIVVGSGVLAYGLSASKVRWRTRTCHGPYYVSYA